MRIGKWISLGIIPALLCSCSLLPQEEEYVRKPMIRSYVQAEYDLSYVQFGDVVLTENIACKYMPVSTQQLCFTVGGVYYDEIYVEKGDLVQKGDLVAQLEVSGLDEEIESLQKQMEDMYRSISNLQEQRALAVDSQRRILAAMSSAQAAGQKTPEELRAEYDEQIETIEENLEIYAMRLEEAQAELAERSLYAGIDGAVTFVRKIEEGTKSVEGDLVVSIADATNSVFSAETANYDLLLEGTIVSIFTNKEYWPAEVVSAQALGLEEEYSKTGKKTVYFRLTTPNADLESGDRGSLTLVIAESRDTLYIPKGALHTVEGRNFVYQMDEQGLKTMVDVEIGLTTNNYVEILSGLAEGDNVIC